MNTFYCTVYCTADDGSLNVAYAPPAPDEIEQYRTDEYQAEDMKLITYKPKGYMLTDLELCMIGAMVKQHILDTLK